MVFAPLDGAVGLILLWIAVGATGLAAPRSTFLATRALYPAGAAIAAALAVVALLALGEPPRSMVLPLGLPDLPFHLRLDALSAFFLLLLAAAACGVSLFSAGYFRAAHATPPGLVCFQYHVFLASMALVLLADDAYLFMLSWESMALASYFLVTTEHGDPAVRRAGFLYLLIAHVGALAVLLSFGVMQGADGSYTFEAMRAAEIAPGWASVAFCLAFLGFGAKAGLVPLHAWLPEAHPAAPSPVSALMSGVMLKTAIYGMVRVTYDLLGDIQWQWGLGVLVVGTVTMIFGILFAVVQQDLKRLLAYSSVENIGIVLVALGLSLIYLGSGNPVLGVLALVAALYHALNHALYKSLLFLGAGAVLHATGERDLGRMGGLIRTMPFTAFLFLTGVFCIAALPPLNGFVSEWLIFQAALLSPGLGHGVLRSIIPAAAAALALCGALTALCFVKVFGVAFLGAPRSGAPGHEPDRWQQAGMALLALLCVGSGLAPVWVIGRIDAVTSQLTGETLSGQLEGWLWLAPVAAERASYSPLVFLVVIALVVLAVFWMVRALYHGRLRRTGPWDCGFGPPDARMQDSPQGFAQPIRQIFAPVFAIERHVPSPGDAAPAFSETLRDRLWGWLYQPFGRATEFAARQIGRLQGGSISAYLLYSFVTLVFLLVFVR